MMIRKLVFLIAVLLNALTWTATVVFIGLFISSFQAHGPLSGDQTEAVLFARSFGASYGLISLGLSLVLSAFLIKFV